MDKIEMTFLEKLIDAARDVEMTDSEREIQRQSFAYGNTKIENERITREMISEQSARLAEQNG